METGAPTPVLWPAHRNQCFLISTSQGKICFKGITPSHKENEALYLQSNMRMKPQKGYTISIVSILL